jgi:hypothetical protein
VDRTFSWEYLAGIFDGEGWITCPLSKGYPNLRVCIAQSGDLGYSLLTGIQAWLGERGINSKVYAGRMTYKATLVPYRLVIAQKDSAYTFLRNLQPHLHIKAEQIHEALWKRELWWLAKEITREPREWLGEYVERCVI